MSAGRAGRGRDRLVLLHEERDLIVIDKPAGLLTMPSAPGRAEHEDSVLARARTYARHKRGRQAYVGLLHRLDRGTSGALAIALDRQVHAAGRANFKAHAFDRTYLALVRGVPHPAAATIDEPISATYRDGRRDIGHDDEDALDARTHYRVVESFGEEASLVELTLETGRQHQIRIHLASLGHPVMGDRVYGPARDSAKPSDRPLLHAWRLAFPHPVSGRPIAVEAPLPRDFTSRLVRLRRMALGDGLQTRDAPDAPSGTESGRQGRSQRQGDRRHRPGRAGRRDSR